MVKSILIDDNLNLTQENGYYLQEVKNLGYTTKYSFSNILQKHGAKIGNVLFKNKAFSITLLVVGSSFSDLTNKRSALFQSLTVNPYNTNDKINFEFTLMNNQVVTLSGVVKDVNSDISNENLLATSINFVIETEYPFLKSKINYQQIFNIAVGGGATIPMSIPLDFSKGETQYSTLTNGGNVFAFPIFKFYGKLTNPVLIDIDNSKSMSISETIANNNYYIIDTYERTVLDSLGNNKLNKLTGDFLFLMVGENHLKLLTDDTGDNGYIKVIWNYHYVSI